MYTDTMLPALCSLLTALSCVSGVTVVTQKPPVLTLTRGQTADVDLTWGPLLTVLHAFTNRFQEEFLSFCTFEDTECITVRFGRGTKLIISDAALPPPVLNLLPPSSEDLKSTSVTVVCLVNDEAAGGFADVRWLVNGTPVTSGVITGSAQQQDNKKFSISSFFTFHSSEWENDTVITCEVSSGGKAALVKIKKSECSEGM